ncbi:MAG: hypothetical protein HYT37_04030 [Candidatus Sungbacteria bacterium]|nr:hypothetical protein [Candidatus Sungbacteria bacterium]
MSKESYVIDAFGKAESMPEQEKNIQDFEYQIKLREQRIHELMGAAIKPPRPEARNEIARDIDKQKAEIRAYEGKIATELQELVSFNEARLAQAEGGGKSPEGTEAGDKFNKKRQEQIDMLTERTKRYKKRLERYGKK